MKAETEHILQVESWIESLVVRGEGDLVNLVERLPGVDPIYVIKVLDRLRKAKNGKVFGALHEQASKPTRPVQFPKFCFVPHPLDFDWRFTEPSAFELVRRVLAYITPTRLALLGTPSLVPIIQALLPSSDVWLLDKNPLWATQLDNWKPGVQFTVCDLTVDNPHVDSSSWADVVLMDPPWYMSIQKAYLWIAAHLVRPGGYVVSTVPPIGVRPQVLDERNQITDFARRAGLIPVELSERAVRYLTSPFEVNAMRAAGVCRAFLEWRCGDLIIFQVERPNSTNRPHLESQSSVWSEAIIDGVRIKLRMQSTVSGETKNSPELESLVHGDILPSVSSRHPMRAIVDVWTSGNRIFKCRNTAMLLQLSRSLSHNKGGGCAVSLQEEAKAIGLDLSTVGCARDQLLTLVKTESQEYLSGS